MFKAIRYAGKVYQNDLASRIKALGYQIADEHDKQGNIRDGESKVFPRKSARNSRSVERRLRNGMAKFEADYGRPPSRAEISVITRETREKKFDNSNRSATKSTQISWRRIKAEHVALLKTLVDGATPMELRAWKRKKVRHCRRPSLTDSSG